MDFKITKQEVKDGKLTVSIESTPYGFLPDGTLVEPRQKKEDSEDDKFTRLVKLMREIK